MTRTALDGYRGHLQRGQRGVGMIEVMVAMVLGAMVVIGVIQVFTANRLTFRMQDGMAITQEGGTFAVDFISRDVLRGGLRMTDAPGTGLNEFSFDWTATADGVAGANDTLAVVYSPDNVLTDGDDVALCTGDTVTDPARIRNRYWVSDANELMCQGDNYTGGAYVPVGTAQALVSNVESFQVLFGVDTRVTDALGECVTGIGAPTLYVRATQVARAVERADELCSAEQSAATVIRAVRIGLLLSTENTAGTIVDRERQYDVLDQAIGFPDIDPADGRLRRLFTRTVLLRNAEQVQSLNP